MESDPAAPLLQDRWGHTPIDDARRSGLDALLDLGAPEHRPRTPPTSNPGEVPASPALRPGAKWIPQSLSFHGSSTPLPQMAVRLRRSESSGSGANLEREGR